MINIFKKNSFINNLLSSKELSTKIKLFFSTRTIGEDFDSYEKNYTYNNLNPITIRGYVRDLRPESLVWRQYGLSETGAKEIICADKYIEWFKNCNKIEIDNDSYQTYKENVGNRFLITKLPFKLARVVIRKIE